MRLIDADALKENLLFSSAMYDDDWVMHVPIKEMDAAIDNAPTVGEWISTENRLPDDGEKLPIEAKWVLVWLGVEPFQTYVPLPAKYNWFSRTWTVVGLSDDMNKRVKITHWMELPEPPKGGSSDD